MQIQQSITLKKEKKSCWYPTPSTKVRQRTNLNFISILIIVKPIEKNSESRLLLVVANRVTQDTFLLCLLLKPF